MRNFKRDDNIGVNVRHVNGENKSKEGIINE